MQRSRANWTKRKLIDVTTKIGSGATPRGGQGAYHQAGIPLIRSLNIYDLNFSYDDLAFIDVPEPAYTEQDCKIREVEVYNFVYEHYRDESFAYA